MSDPTDARAPSAAELAARTARTAQPADSSNGRLRVVFLDAGTLPGGLPLQQVPAIDYVAHDASAAAQVAERIRNAQVVITNKVALGRRELAAAPDLKLVLVAAAGIDIIDMEAARGRGVAVRNVPDYGSDSVAEHALATLFALRRNLMEYAAAARDGRWSASGRFCWHGPAIRDLKGSTLGVAGFGRIGRALAERAQGLGIQVLRAQPPGRPPQPGSTPWAEVLRRADALSLHLPLTDGTRGLVDAQALSLMQPHAVLINTGRGALVDSQALVAALRAGRLGGAAIDVLDHEPPPPGHPLLAPDVPGLLLTPHVAWASEQAQARLGHSLVQWVLAAQRQLQHGAALPDRLELEAAGACGEATAAPGITAIAAPDAAARAAPPAGPPAGPPADPLAAELEAVARRWAGARDQWFSHNPDFDASIRRDWASLHERVLAVGVAPERIQRLSAQAALGWIVLLDQYPRNAYRGTARIYDSDALARAMTAAAIEVDHDLAVEPEVRRFFYLPYMHAENPAAQERGVELHLRGGLDARFAVHHRDIVRRFGRFPHRNEMLGRTSSEAELRYLADGGFRG